MKAVSSTRAATISNMTTMHSTIDQQQRRTLAILESLAHEYGRPEQYARQEPVDELIQTILSQNTSDLNTERAFNDLKSAFANWEAVIEAPTDSVASAIRHGGLANIKAPRIQQVLSTIRSEVGDFNLRFLGQMSSQDAMNWLTALPGVGPKTAACVLLFSLDVPVMPVDTHVHRVSQRLELIPGTANAVDAQPILEHLIEPKSIYAAHMLMITHGRRTCRARKPACTRCCLQHCCPSALDFLKGEKRDQG